MSSGFSLIGGRCKGVCSDGWFQSRLSNWMNTLIRESREPWSSRQTSLMRISGLRSYQNAALRATSFQLLPAESVQNSRVYSATCLFSCLMVFTDLHPFRTVIKNSVKQLNELLVRRHGFSALLPYSSHPHERFTSEKDDKLGYFFLVCGPHLTKEEKEAL